MTRRVAHPYCGTRVALATMHGKEVCLARPFAVLGMHVTVPSGLDTDALGTFTCEVERVGTPREVVLRKARLGLRASPVRLGLASEGSYGPDPLLGVVPAGQELLAFVDDELGVEVVEAMTTFDTNFAHEYVERPDDLGPFLERVGFPAHAVIVQPSTGWDPDASVKGLQDAAALGPAIERARRASGDGRVLVQTDMRAHVNPTRRRVIRSLSFRLVRRLARQCPACEAPGFGAVRAVRGLPCEWCGTPTHGRVATVLGCSCCAHQVTEPVMGPAVASAARCARCNP